MQHRVSILFLSLFISFLISSSSSTMSATEEQIANSGDVEAAVHIVHLDRPEGVDPEAFHIRTLAAVVGSEEAAKDCLIYHYTHAASGFSAKLTPKQVSDLSERPEVLQVTPSRTLQLHGAMGVGGIRPGIM